MSLPDALLLQHRSGLPDALRVLLEDHPRAAWEAHAEFHGLVSFWLQRHMMFRKIMATLIRDAETVLDRNGDADRFRQRLAQLGSQFVNELHGHHGIEDQHYFPVLARADARVARGFEILDSDHQALDGLLNRFVENANGVLRADPVAFHSQTGAYLDELTVLTGLLDRHLVDEEELVVPVILTHGASGLS